MKEEIYTRDYPLTWLTVWGIGHDCYYFTILKRIGKLTDSPRTPYLLLTSVTYKDLLLLFVHADFLQSIAEELVTEVTAFGLTTFYYYEYRACYFAALQREFFNTGGVRFPVFPIGTTKRDLERRFRVCLDEQARAAKLHRDPTGGLTPASIDRLWTKMNKFDYTGNGNSEGK